jgi:hypothetical protein
MSVVLPKEIAYSPALPNLPECLSQEVVVNPSNGNSFNPTGNNKIIFDLPSRGYLDPNSFHIRYKYSLTNTATQTSTIRGTPCYSFFSQLQTLFGSTIVENIVNYNQVCNMWVQLQYDVAMKYGQQYNMGYRVLNNAVPSLEDLDGRKCAEGESVSLSCPLPCLISQADKLVPLGHMPLVRLELTLDQIGRIFATTVGNNLPTDYEIFNVELVYNMIDFNGEVNELVKGMGDQIFIKSTSFQNIGSNLSTGFQGSTELVYNMRLASIKSLFALPQGLSNRCVNGIFDSIDLTSGFGDYQFVIAGTQYPPKALSTSNNKAGLMMSLKGAVGATHSDTYNTSINSIEFDVGDAGTTTVVAPGKFYVAVNTEKLSSNGVLLSGISTQNSPINLRINYTGANATSQAYNINLIAMYDCLISVDPINRQATVRQ